MYKWLDRADFKMSNRPCFRRRSRRPTGTRARPPGCLEYPGRGFIGCCVTQTRNLRSKRSPDPIRLSCLLFFSLFTPSLHLPLFLLAPPNLLWSVSFRSILFRYETFRLPGLYYSLFWGRCSRSSFPPILPAYKLLKYITLTSVLVDPPFQFLKSPAQFLRFTLVIKNSS